MKYSLSFLAFLICLHISHIQAQDLSIAETLDYLNEKLNKHKDLGDSHAKFKWKISSSGQLSVERYWYDKLSSTYTVYVQELDENGVHIAPNNEPTDKVQKYNYIQCYSTNYKECITANFQEESYKSFTSSMFVVKFTDDEKIANEVRNAIVHLIKTAKKNPDYRKKDPFDY